MGEHMVTDVAIDGHMGVLIRFWCPGTGVNTRGCLPYQLVNVCA